MEMLNQSEGTACLVFALVSQQEGMRFKISEI